MRNYLKFITESSWPKSPHLYNAPLLIVTRHSAENEQETGQKKVLTKSEKYDWGHIAKNGQKTHFQLKIALFD